MYRMWICRRNLVIVSHLTSVRDGSAGSRTPSRWMSSSSPSALLTLRLCVVKIHPRAVPIAHPAPAVRVVRWHHQPPHVGQPPRRAPTPGRPHRREPTPAVHLMSPRHRRARDAWSVCAPTSGLRIRCRHPRESARADGERVGGLNRTAPAIRSERQMSRCDFGTVGRGALPQANSQKRRITTILSRLPATMHLVVARRILDDHNLAPRLVNPHDLARCVPDAQVRDVVRRELANLAQ